MRPNQIFIFCGILLVVIVGGSFLYANYKYKMPEYVSCNRDAKICPDGSTVGRSGPKCEFAECPPSAVATSTNSTNAPIATTSTVVIATSTSVKIPPSKTTPSKTTAVSFSGTVLAGASEASPLLEFDPLDYHAASRSNKVIVLFFYTSWDQFSQSEFESLERAFDSLPSGAVGFRVHYNDSVTSADEKLLARDLGVGASRTKILQKNESTLFKSTDPWAESDFTTEIKARM